jgi:hypothetical protein
MNALSRLRLGSWLVKNSQPNVEGLMMVPRRNATILRANSTDKTSTQWLKRLFVEYILPIISSRPFIVYCSFRNWNLAWDSANTRMYKVHTWFKLGNGERWTILRCFDFTLWQPRLVAAVTLFASLLHNKIHVLHKVDDWTWCDRGWEASKGRLQDG